MKKGRTIGQFMDIFIKIICSFGLVFALYFITKFLDSFTFKYFIFPFISIIIIFICGINVGRSLEKIKHNESTGVFTKIPINNEESETEFYVNDTRQIITNKKILKELEDGDIVHVKTNKNYNIEEEKQNVESVE